MTIFLEEGDRFKITAYTPGMEILSQLILLRNNHDIDIEKDRQPRDFTFLVKKVTGDGEWFYEDPYFTQIMNRG